MLKRSYSRSVFFLCFKNYFMTTVCVFLVYFQIQVFNGIFSLINYSKKAINKFFFLFISPFGFVAKIIRSVWLSIGIFVCSSI